MNFAKLLRTPFYRAPPDDCFFILQIHKSNLTRSVTVRRVQMHYKLRYTLFMFWRSYSPWLSFTYLFCVTNTDQISVFLKTTEIPVGKYLKSYSYSSSVFIGLEQVFSFSDGDFSCIYLSLIKSIDLV